MHQCHSECSMRHWLITLRESKFRSRYEFRLHVVEREEPLDSRLFRLRRNFIPMSNSIGSARQCLVFISNLFNPLVDDFRAKRSRWIFIWIHAMQYYRRHYFALVCSFVSSMSAPMIQTPSIDET